MPLRTTNARLLLRNQNNAFLELEDDFDVGVAEFDSFHTIQSNNNTVMNVNDYNQYQDDHERNDENAFLAAAKACSFDDHPSLVFPHDDTIFSSSPIILIPSSDQDDDGNDNCTDNPKAFGSGCDTSLLDTDEEEESKLTSTGNDSNTCKNDYSQLIREMEIAPILHTRPSLSSSRRRLEFGDDATASTSTTTLTSNLTDDEETPWSTTNTSASTFTTSPSTVGSTAVQKKVTIQDNLNTIRFFSRSKEEQATLGRGKKKSCVRRFKKQPVMYSPFVLDQSSPLKHSSSCTTSSCSHVQSIAKTLCTTLTKNAQELEQQTIGASTKFKQALASALSSSSLPESPSLSSPSSSGTNHSKNTSNSNSWEDMIRELLIHSWDKSRFKATLEESSTALSEKLAKISPDCICQPPLSTAPDTWNDPSDATSSTPGCVGKKQSSFAFEAIEVTITEEEGEHDDGPCGALADVEEKEGASRILDKRITEPYPLPEKQSIVRQQQRCAREQALHVEAQEQQHVSKTSTNTVTPNPTVRAARKRDVVSGARRWRKAQREHARHENGRDGAASPSDDQVSPDGEEGVVSVLTSSSSSSTEFDYEVSQQTITNPVILQPVLSAESDENNSRSSPQDATRFPFLKPKMECLKTSENNEILSSSIRMDSPNSALDI